MSEIAVFSKDLLRQVEQQRPEDAIEFAISYFKQLQTCSHVMSTNYTYACETIHNRKSLVYCLMDSFKGFDSFSEITVTELHFLVEAVCPGFPKSLILQAATSTSEYLRGSSISLDTKYPLLSIVRGLYCHILFEDWLKVVDEFFREEGGKLLSVNSQKIKTKMEQLYNSLATTVYQPPLAAILGAVESVEAGKVIEITLDKFKRDVFTTPSMSAELLTIGKYNLTFF